ncbi:hypothetical protein [Rhodopseudomonas sp. B29]|uniref:hypothetical protein n=1 Tax=Rhodopseudomonas sp. B29 TaxID=95607 RepID=UPI00034DF3D2|nr:hypothetical protein [Rhodopseudomonas sp. B29]
MTDLWIDDGNHNPEQEHADPALPPPCLEAEVESETAEAEPLRTRYTDRPIRPSSNFVAQLMAIDGGYPQTRDHDRAEPDLASAAYRSTAYRPVRGFAARPLRSS